MTSIECGPRRNDAPGTRWPTTLATVVLIAVTVALQARAQTPAAQQIQGLYDKAVQVFASVNQPDSIPLFTAIVEQIRQADRGAGGQAPDLALLLYRSLRYRNEANFNLTPSTRVDPDLCAAAKDGFRIDRTEVSAAFYGLLGKGCPLLVAAPAPAAGYLVIAVVPGDARVWIDVAPASAPSGFVSDLTRPVAVTPGRHVVHVASPGYVTSSLPVTVASGQRVPLAATLIPYGTLLISIRPADATVELNGRIVDISRPIPVPPGPQTVRVHRGGDYVPQALRVSAAPGQQQRVQVDLDKTERPHPRRVFFAMDRSYRMRVPTFTSSSSFPVYGQTAHLSTDYTIADDMERKFSIGGAVRAVGPLAIGVTYSEVVLTGDAAISGTVPTQFILNRPRLIGGVTQGLERAERALHLEVRATGGGKYAEAAVFGGPSFFSVSQSFVDRVVFREPGPVYLSATTMRLDAPMRTGVHVGGDVSVLVAGYVGFGFTVRYSYGEVTFTAPDGTPMPARVGGVQFGGGVRLRF